MKHVRLSYFALFRECAGRASEELESDAATLGELYAELRARYRVPLDAERVRVAVDEAYVRLDTPVREGMHVTFIPPVAGG
jgi:molybdopterin converting factor subunit 1